mmetsp:Transcript_21458/g.44123  ORF Transcript_21458/g.44123 Transcript_21458/m.44123 type:complete len:241 (-) Transcript_21458:1144-1866(-)
MRDIDNGRNNKNQDRTLTDEDMHLYEPANASNNAVDADVDMLDDTDADINHANANNKMSEIATNHGQYTRIPYTTDSEWDNSPWSSVSYKKKSKSRSLTNSPSPIGTPTTINPSTDIPLAQNDYIAPHSSAESSPRDNTATPSATTISTTDNANDTANDTANKKETADTGRTHRDAQKHYLSRGLRAHRKHRVAAKRHPRQSQDPKDRTRYGKIPLPSPGAEKGCFVLGLPGLRLVLPRR